MTRIVLVALCSATLVLSKVSISAASTGDSKAAVVERVSEEMAAFSKADRAAFVASYVEAPSILDDVAPYAFSNAGRWFDAVRPKFAVVTMTPGAPLEVLVDRIHAFVSLRFTFEGKSAKGTPFKAAGYWSGAMVKVAGSWRIGSSAITLTQ